MRCCGLPAINLRRVVGNSLLSSFLILNLLFGYHLNSLMVDTNGRRPRASRERVVPRPKHGLFSPDESELEDEHEDEPMASGMLWEMEAAEAAAHSEEDEDHNAGGNTWMDAPEVQPRRQTATEVAVQLARRQSDAALEMARSGRARARSSQLRDIATRGTDERHRLETELQRSHAAHSNDAIANAKARLDTLKQGAASMSLASNKRHSNTAMQEALSSGWPSTADLASTSSSGRGATVQLPVRKLDSRKHFQCSKYAADRAESEAATPTTSAKPASWWSAVKGETTAAAAAAAAEEAEAEAAEAMEERICAAGMTHVAMSLDSNYLRGLVALVNSINTNAACPDSVFYHFPVLSADEPKALALLMGYFPRLNYRTYHIDKYDLSSSVRSMGYRSHDLESPLNYARIYLPDMLPRCVRRCIYLDTDMIVLDRIEEFWETDLEGYVISSPEFCEFKLFHYFTDYFWHNRTLSQKFNQKRNACYFNPGVMLFDTDKWRSHKISQKLLYWMKVQKEGKERIYRLGSLPPFLLVFSGNLKSVDKEWNRHDLGCGCNVKVDPKKAKLLHWSCDGKPWRRLDGHSGKACSNDRNYWAPFDLVGKARSLAVERPEPEAEAEARSVHRARL